MTQANEKLKWGLPAAPLCLTPSFRPSHYQPLPSSLISLPHPVINPSSSLTKIRAGLLEARARARALRVQAEGSACSGEGRVALEPGKECVMGVKGQTQRGTQAFCPKPSE